MAHIGKNKRILARKSNPTEIQGTQFLHFFQKIFSLTNTTKLEETYYSNHTYTLLMVTIRKGNSRVLYARRDSK